MKKFLFMGIVIGVLSLMVSCTQTESSFDDEQIESQLQVVLSSSQTNLVQGNSVTLNLVSNAGINLNSETIFFINNVPIPSNTYEFQNPGQYTAKAVYGNLVSNEVQLLVTPAVGANQFVNRVFVEEFSGTWCGNCPRILYGTELLKQQTSKAVVVQIHLFNGDPFITSQGNALAGNLGVNGVPTGRINRTINWSGPQYQNVNQVINEIRPSSPVGLALSSTLNNNTLNINVKMGFSDLGINGKLMVYLVEDNLFHTQSNYSSNLYGGLSSIPNFEYDGVLRSVVSSLSGDAIGTVTNEVTKSYSLPLPSVISATANAKIVAFLIDGNGSVLNVREAGIGVTQQLELQN